MRKSLGIAALLIAFVGCKSRLKYPGFTRVASANGENYLVDQGSIVRTGAMHVVAVSQLIEHTDGSHSVGDIAINCVTGASFVGESSLFDSSGKFINSSKEQIKDEKAVVDYVCERVKSLPIISGQFVEAAVVEQVLGGNGWSWNPIIPTDLNINAEGGQSFKAEVILDKDFVEGGQGRRILVLSSVPEHTDYSCHACGVLISAFVFRHADSGWFLDSQNAYSAVAGSWGKPPEAALAKLGPDRFGFGLTQSDGGQGQEDGGTEYFGPIGDSIASLLTVVKYGSYTGETEAESATLNTAEQWGPHVTNGYYDVKLSTTGTKLNDSMVPVSAAEEKVCRMGTVKYDCQ